MPALVRQSNVVAEANVAAASVSSVTITGVAAGNCLVAIVVVHSPTGNTNDLCTGFGTTISGTAANTWTLARREGELDSGGYWYSELTIWTAPNVSAGTTVGKPTFSSDALYVRVHMDEFSGLVTTSVVDTAASGSSDNTTTQVSTGSSGTLAQASQIIVAAFGGRYQYRINNGESGPGIAPTGYTILQGTTDNSLGVIGQSVYREVSSTDAVSVTWTYGAPGVGLAALVTLKAASAGLRLEVDNIKTSIDTTTGWTFWAWSDDPLDGSAKKRWQSYTASVSGGKLIFPDAPAGAAAGSTFNVMGYQPSGTLTTGMMVGVVRSV